jgi:uncharacterized membrane protein
MAVRKIKSNTLIIYILVAVAVIVLVIWLAGGTTFNGRFHGNHTYISTGWNWIQILISLAIGFVLGILFSRRR